LLLRTALVLSLLLGCLAKAEGQGFVYPVGNVARQPTAALPNPNGYKLIQGFHNEFGHTGVDLANGAEGGDVHAIGPGTVSIRQDTATSKGWGNVVFIRHDLPDG